MEDIEIKKTVANWRALCNDKSIICLIQGFYAKEGGTSKITGTSTKGTAEIWQEQLHNSLDKWLLFVLASRYLKRIASLLEMNASTYFTQNDHVT